MPATPTRSTATPSAPASRVYVELPASRASARASSSTGTPTTARQTRARTQSATPSLSASASQPHSPAPHLSKADERAAEEAQRLMGNMEGSARSRRHEKLSRLRDQTPVDADANDGQDDEDEDEDETVRSRSASQERQHQEQEDEHVFGTDPTVPAGTGVGRSTDDVESDRSDHETSINGSTAANDVVADNGEGDDDDEEHGASDATSSVVSSSSESTSSAPESDSEDDVDSEDDDGSGSDNDDNEELEKLLQSARLEAAKTGQSIGGSAADGVAGGHDVVSFDTDEGAGSDRRRREAPIPDITVTKMPRPHLSFTADGTAKASSTVAGPSRPKAKHASANAPELDDQPYERQLSKREKAAQPKKATATELWSKLPAPKADLLPQMRKDYQALSLANSLDPKRFMKGGSRSGKIPDNFAIGTMIEAPRQLQDTTLAREKQYRPGQVVQNLIRDEPTGSYAKRKYGDLQKTRMDNGRGRGWKKQRGW